MLLRLLAPVPSLALTPTGTPKGTRRALARFPRSTLLPVASTVAPNLDALASRVNALYSLPIVWRALMALSFVIAGSSGDVPCLRSVCRTVAIHIGECVSYVSGGSHICAVLVGVDTSSCAVVQWEFANAFIVEEDGRPVLHTCSEERRPSPYEVLQIYDEDTKIHIATSQVMQKAAVLGEQEWARLCSGLKSDVPLHTYFSRYMRVSQGTGQGLRKAIVSKHPMQAPAPPARP